MAAHTAITIPVMRIVTQPPSVNFSTSSTASIPAVTVSPMPERAMRRFHLRSSRRLRHHRMTRPRSEIEKVRNTLIE